MSKEALSPTTRPPGAARPSDSLTIRATKITVGTFRCGRCDVIVGYNGFSWFLAERRTLPGGGVGPVHIPVQQIQHIEINRTEGILGFWVVTEVQGTGELSPDQFDPLARRSDPRSLVQLYYNKDDFAGGFPKRMLEVR